MTILLRIGDGHPGREQSADACQEFATAIRLGHVIIRTGFKTNDAGVFSGAGREHQDRDRCRYCFTAKNFANGHSVKAGQEHIQENEVGTLTFRGFNGRPTIPGHHGLEAGGLEIEPDQLNGIRLILNDQDSRRVGLLVFGSFLGTLSCRHYF